MANILILTLVFPPDNVSTAQIMGSLAEELSKLGHDVTVVTTTPHYNRDMEAEERQPLHKSLGGLLYKSHYKTIPVFHIRMPRKGTSIYQRLLSWIGFHIISTLVGLIAIPRPDLIIAPSPPLTIGLSAWFLSIFHKASYIYNVQEIYPDCAIKLGLLRNPMFIKILLWLEYFIYQKALMVTVITPGMAERLLQKGLHSQKIKIIPNFVDVEELKPLPKNNEFSRRYNIQEKFVISYAGNMGLAQNLEVFIEAAEILRNNPDIHFLMMGDGMLRDELQRRVARLELVNITFLSYQPYSLIPQVYSASDLCLVPLSAELATEAIPSKVYRIMACARPVLAFADEDSDLGKLIREVNAGLVVSPLYAEGLARTIVYASQHQDEIQTMGERGRKHVAQYYTKEIVARQYDKVIRLSPASLEVAHVRR